ncbi:MAG: hypothetical protein Q9170_007398 [Blastenia crenularia]
MILVIYEPGSDWDKKVKALGPGKLPSMDEAQREEDDETDDEYERQTKRVKTEPTDATGSSTQVGLTGHSLEQSLSGNIASGWSMQFGSVKSILPVKDAAKQLVSFYKFVVDKASAQIEAGAVELGKLSFKLGGISLVLTGTDVIYWDWIVNFAMAMEDSTNLGNPIQYASTVKSTWEENTINAELLLEGAGAA